VLALADLLFLNTCQKQLVRKGAFRTIDIVVRSQAVVAPVRNEIDEGERICRLLLMGTSELFQRKYLRWVVQIPGPILNGELSFAALPAQPAVEPVTVTHARDLAVAGSPGDAPVVAIFGYSRQRIREKLDIFRNT
jgi:hypothetical protein